MRIATFNAENLFTRAKVLNFTNNADGDVLLNKIAELQGELKKPVYDKPQILALYNALKEYIEIAEERGKLFKRQGFAIKGIAANGVNDWDGTIVFKREKFTETTRINTARVIKDLKADVQCLVEVEDRHVIDNFNSDMLGNKKFPYNILIDGNDPRGIDVGLLSRYPINNICTHIFDKEKPSSRSFIFSRDCLEVALQLPGGQLLHVLSNHFKSKGYSTSPAASDGRRKLQAERVRDILKEKYDLKKDLVAVLGDFNDTPGSAPLKPLLNMPDLKDVLQLQFGNDINKTYTYFFKKKIQIDFILVSAPLQAAFAGAGVERRGMFDINTLSNGAETRYDTVTSKANAASDHAGVWADFTI
ncbi:MAG TPA: endonuclease/exonuclease/phosphatase family protein [Ferruginibacter sp.]|nr:endonuclease/exonuclease/phosphatase family protein [Ferruginibacter sp.]HMP20261.1 endonuclease/exonuclease/phosphatase family protein [Ferruginibacter sp.]